MKNFLKYTAIGFVSIALIVTLMPMIGGLLFGVAIALLGVWGYERSHSFIMKLFNGTVIGLGAVCIIGNIPSLLLLAIPLVGYYVYKIYTDRDFKGKEQDPFDNFEAEWNKIMKF